VEHTLQPGTVRAWKQDRKVPRPASPPYSSKIIKSGALIGETKTLLSHWNATLSVEENLRALLRDNVLGKTSRSRVEDVFAIFRQRYLTEEPVTRALVALVRGKLPSSALKPIFYFHAARADRLLHDVVTEILLLRKNHGLVDVHVSDLNRILVTWVEEGKTKGRWSHATITRISRGLLSTLRDFGVLQGAVNKRIVPPFLPTEAFAYIAFYLKQQQPSGAKLLDLPDWKLFFLTREGVERSLFEAHQRRLLEYHVAGSVTRLTFPATTLDEYANVLAEK
jgi:hypothetical protein